MKQTHRSFSISFVSGPPGTGKSFLMARDVVDRLINSNVRIITNLPLVLEVVCDYVAKKLGVTSGEIADRIVLIDAAAISRWQDGDGGPWEIYEGDQQSCAGCDFILDECHLFCITGRGSADRNKRWTKWLGTVRHEGWRRLVFISQDETKVGEPVKVHAELNFECTNSERDRDPFLRVPLTDWYELIASFTREYISSVTLIEYRRIGRRSLPRHRERYVLDPFWFAFYRSYEAPGGGAGKQADSAAIVREYKLRPVFWIKRINGVLWLPTWAWFLRSHWWRFALATSTTVGIFWLSLWGGMATLTEKWLLEGKSLAAGAMGDKKNVGVVVAGSQKDAVSTKSVGSVGNGPTQVLPDAKAAVAAGVLSEGLSANRARDIARQLSAVTDPDVRRDILEQLSAFASESAEIDAARIKQMEAERELERDRVLAIDEKTVWFAGGVSYKIGEVIDHGAFAGKRIRNIDLSRRRVEFGDGKWVGVGGVAGVPGRVPGASDAVKPARNSEGAGISDGLRSVVTKGTSRGQRGSVAGQKNQPGSAGYAPEGTSENAGGQVRGVGGDRRGAGGQNSDAGNQGPAVRSGDSPSGSSGGSELQAPR